MNDTYGRHVVAYMYLYIWTLWEKDDQFDKKRILEKNELEVLVVGSGFWGLGVGG